MSMFSPAVAEKLRFYVYRLIDIRNGETFYVGKGTGNRVFQHAGGTLDGVDDAGSEKLLRIRAIQLAGFDVAHVIHRHGMDEATAFEVEAALMEAYPGLANIAGGHGSDEFGVLHAEEINRRYEAPVAEFRHRVLMLNVDKLAAEESLYEATRYAWRIDAAKARAVQYVLPVVQGVIRGAFIAEEWLPATEANFPGKQPMPGRHGFVGHVAPAEIVQLYSRKRVPDEYRKRGAANPAKYAGPDACVG
jgi:hypothetical protein